MIPALSLFYTRDRLPVRECDIDLGLGSGAPVLSSTLRGSCDYYLDTGDMVDLTQKGLRQ